MSTFCKWNIEYKCIIDHKNVGVVVNNSFFNAVGCCGGQELYDESSQICCEYKGSFSINNNKNRDCCYDRAYNTVHQHCAKGRVLNFNEDFCGINKYNVSAKICCGGTLHDRPLFLPKCCGSNLYDFSQSQCCLGTKKVVALNLQCCGEGKWRMYKTPLSQPVYVFTI